MTPPADNDRDGRDTPRDHHGQNHDTRAESNRALVLETANRVALDILAQETGVEALRHIAEAARTLSGARYAALGVARPDGDGLEEFLTVGLTPEQEAAIGPRPVGKGVLGHLLTCDQPLLVPDLEVHPSRAGFPPNHPPMRGFLGVPIRRGEQILGSLYLTDKADGTPFNAGDAAAVEALSAHAAVAIHHLRLIARQRALLGALFDAQEEERRALAYDLHDGLTQYVMAASAYLEAFRAEREDAGDTLSGDESFGLALTCVKEAVAESRRLVNGLRALALDDLGLAGAMEQLFGEEKGRAGWPETEFVHNVAGQRFDRTLETAVYRVAQEALTNVRKHAGANRVRVSLLLDTAARRLTLEVRDWGRGLPPTLTPPDSPGFGASETYGFGLHGMRERADHSRGSFRIEPAPGGGTRVRATFPVEGG